MAVFSKFHATPAAAPLAGTDAANSSSVKANSENWNEIIDRVAAIADCVEPIRVHGARRPAASEQASVSRPNASVRKIRRRIATSDASRRG